MAKIHQQADYNNLCRGYVARAVEKGDGIALYHLRTYTQANMERLSPQQKKIVCAIQVLENPSVKEIARRVFLDENIVSSQLAVLRSGYVVLSAADKTDRRSMRYRLADSLLIKGLQLNAASGGCGPVFDLEKFWDELQQALAEI